MGSFLNPGHTYTDGSTVTGPNLTEHVAEATFKPEAITDLTLRIPAVLTDQLLVAAGGVLYQETLQQIHDLILYPGSVVQTQYGAYTANTNLTATIPLDDTIPQNTEGTEILSLSITPRFATSVILARFQGQFALSIVGSATAALFVDATVSAIAATSATSDTANFRRHFIIEKPHSPATTSAVTYKIRVGPNAASTMRMNGSTVSRDFGGTSSVTLVLQEIKQ